MGWRIIGRIAFPIYAYLVVRGYQITKNKKKYLLRLLIIGLLSQYPYMYGLEISGINVVGTFVICILAMMIMDQVKRIYISVIIILISSCILEFFKFDYGIYALLLILIYRYSKQNRMIGLHIVLNIVFIFYKGWVLQFFSIAPTIAIVYMPHLLKWIEEIRIPRWLWRSFYPVHLSIIAILLFILK